MILTDREIHAALASGQILVAPPPHRDAYSSTSVDLTLAPTIRVWRRNNLAGVEERVISPGGVGYDYRRVVNVFTDSFELGDEGHVLEPGAFLLGWTAERIELPSASRLAARVEGKSSLARLGIAVHVTAPTIHAGFGGHLQLELCNHGILRVRILPAMRVCQVVFEQTLGTPDKGYSGLFADQRAG